MIHRENSPVHSQAQYQFGPDGSQFSHRYSDGVHHKRIAILGPCPPPLGGISVHIQRVMHKFQQQNNKVYHFSTVVEYRYRYLLVYLIHLAGWLVYRRPDQVYYHTSYVSNTLPEMRMLALLKRIFKYELILVDHDCRYLYTRSSRFIKRYNTFMHQVDILVLIGSVTQQSYKDKQLHMPLSTTMEAAFLPPNSATEPQILKTYPSSLHAFMFNHEPLILANAYQLSLLNGKDLYGVDVCLYMLAALSASHPRSGFILALAQIGDEDYFRQICFLAHKLQVTERLYILTQQKELWPLLKKVDLFVRPTLSDGASVSVQEALYFGTPTIASDVCLRPQGTVLFSTGNMQDFMSKVRGCLRKE